MVDTPKDSEEDLWAALSEAGGLSDVGDLSDLPTVFQNVEIMKCGSSNGIRLVWDLPITTL